MNNRPLRIALAKRDFAILRDHRRSYENGERPLSIHLLVDRISEGGAVLADPLRAPRDTIAFVWHLGLDMLAWKLSGRLFAIMIWGIPKRDLVRTFVAKVILRMASAIITNDARSAGEVAALCGRESHRLPFLVDSDYYAFSDSSQRKSFLFCPSSIDRDGDMLAAIAQSGQDVVWMNNDADLIERYKSASERLTIVTRPSFAELRELYSTCRACIIPLRADIHAAGQTTSLEALASGAPLYLSKGRTSQIFEGENLCSVVSEPTVDAWLDALKILPNDTELDRRRAIIDDQYSPKAVGQKYQGVLDAARDR